MPSTKLCPHCELRPAVVTTDSSGLPSETAICTRCHEMLAARRWRGEVWLRTME